MLLVWGVPFVHAVRGITPASVGVAGTGLTGEATDGGLSSDASGQIGLGNRARCVPAVAQPAKSPSPSSKMLRRAIAAAPGAASPWHEAESAIVLVVEWQSKLVVPRVLSIDPKQRRASIYATAWHRVQVDSEGSAFANNHEHSNRI